MLKDLDQYPAVIHVESDEFIPEDVYITVGGVNSDQDLDVGYIELVSSDGVPVELQDVDCVNQTERRALIRNI